MIDDYKQIIKIYATDENLKVLQAASGILEPNDIHLSDDDDRGYTLTNNVTNRSTIVPPKEYDNIITGLESILFEQSGAVFTEISPGSWLYRTATRHVYFRIDQLIGTEDGMTSFSTQGGVFTIPEWMLYYVGVL